mmetsp:Transcript_42324/g.43103  ORF Transcript_42324/g.43103 Transcript_42324/m.43103 type:complete len:174 (+) Transcript_42324:69-590(+)
MRIENSEKSDCDLQNSANVSVRTNLFVDKVGNHEAAEAMMLSKAESGCVDSMYVFGILLKSSGNMNLALSWFLEGSIRGDNKCISALVILFYGEAPPDKIYPLIHYWMKLMEVWDNSMLSECSKSYKYEVGRMEGKHVGEYKHLEILEKYHKPHATEIRDAINRGDHNIPKLQ